MKKKTQKRIVSALLVILMIGIVPGTLSYGVNNEALAAEDEASEALLEVEVETEPETGTESGTPIEVIDLDEEPESLSSEEDTVQKPEAEEPSSDDETDDEEQPVSEGMGEINIAEEDGSLPVEEEKLPAEVSDIPANEEVEKETLAEMEALLPSTLTGDWNIDLISVACSQLGYLAREDGYTRYADWCNQYAASYCASCNAAWYNGELRQSWIDSWSIDTSAPWDACFVTFCLYYAGVSIDRLAAAPTADYWVWLLDTVGMPCAAPSEYDPVPGDLIFFDWDETNNLVVEDENGSEETIRMADHVGIIIDVSEEGFRYISGDLKGTVQEKQIWKADNTILGYAVLQEKPTSEEEPVLDGMSAPRSIVIDTYIFAPEGYVLLRVADNLSEDQSYVFNGHPLYHTSHPAYFVGREAESAFVMLIPAEFVKEGTLTERGAELLTVSDGGRTELIYSSDINEDGVVNIADANAIYQMTQNGGGYYSIDQISIEARLWLQYENIVSLDTVVDEINE